MDEVQRQADVTATQDRPRGLISVADDDASIREALKSLMGSMHSEIDSFGSAEEFLKSGSLTDTVCLVLDIRLPGMNESELQLYLNAAQRSIPIVFISAHADDERDQALKSGAVAVLAKPVRREPLFRAPRQQ